MDIEKQIASLPPEYTSGLTPEERNKLASQVVDKMLAEHTGEDAVYSMRALAVRSLPMGVEKFKHFYWCVFQRELPPIAEYVWVPKLVEAYRDHRGVLIEAFRGATKSTMLVAWIAFITGDRPVGNSILVRINEDAAKETDEAIAKIIESSKAWKACFPYVIPDKDKWGLMGRNVIDARVAGTNLDKIGEWNQMTLADHLGEPSILSAGIESSSIIGKHPSNGEYFDDLHNEKNTRSSREMQTVVAIIEGDIVPTWTRPEGHPTIVDVCTPWNEKDGNQAMLRTGLFEHSRTPICVPADQREIMIGKEQVYPEWTRDYPVGLLDGTPVVSLWNEKYPVEKIQEIKNINPIRFAQMYLCDLSAMKGIVLKKEWLHEYPSDKINPTWPVYIGIDYASTLDRLQEGERDYFALAVGRGVPGGGLILVDGVRVHISMTESITLVKSWASKYPTLVTIGIEKYGKGEEFYNSLWGATELPILRCPVKGTAPRGKGERFQNELSNLFVTSRIWESDVKNDFLMSFEDEWVGWDGQKSRTGHDDVLDSVYWLAYVAMGHLFAPKNTREHLPLPFDVKQVDPYDSLYTR